MGVAKEQARQADLATAARMDYTLSPVEMDYLLSRLHDKDATIERLMKELTTTKRLLLRASDWLVFWGRHMPPEHAFDSEQLRAELMAAQRAVVDDS